MINLPAPFTSCTCSRNHVPHESCQDKYTLLEKGQVAQLKPKNHREIVKLIVIDGCVIKAKNSSKCDGLFIYENDKGQVFSFLVELKNSEKWPKPVHQLEAVRNTSIYKSLISSLSIKKRHEIFVVVGSYIPTALEKRAIENSVGFRVKHIPRTRNTPYPDLKEYLVS
ncbi:MAG: hypothetical protein COA44_04945 [Arcobacter sp.]|nr:MAG: hypothetical protein COA44_04945 [Arcobacter sp.]